MSPRPVRADDPVRAKAMRTPVGYVGQVLGHASEILWECPPRADGRDDPHGGQHHQPHPTWAKAYHCALAELARGLEQGRYR